MDEEGARRAFDAALATYRQDFGTFFLARLLGLEISYPDETCVITFDAADFLFNPQGTLHGGVIATVMDISMGHLLHRASGPAATLEMKTQYLKAVRGGRLTCTGRFLRQGKSISYLASELVDDAGDVVAFATATWRALAASGKVRPRRGGGVLPSPLDAPSRMTSEEAIDLLRGQR